MKSIVNRLVLCGRVALVLAWAAFLIFAWKTHRLEVTNSAFHWMTVGSAPVLVLVGLALLPSRRSKAHAHDHDHEHAHDHDHEETGLAESCCVEPAPFGELVFQALFFVPIVFSLCTPRGTLDAASMARKGIKEFQSATRGRRFVPVEIAAQQYAAAAVASAPATTAEPEPEEVLPPLSMSNLYDYLMMGNPEQLKGREANLTGQFYVDDRCGENQFVVTRVVVTCCLADADVMGIRVNPKKPFKAGESAGSNLSSEMLGEPGGHDLARRMSKLGPWVNVRGKLKMMNDRMGTETIYVDDAEVTTADTPDELLLYPQRRQMSW